MTGVRELFAELSGDHVDWFQLAFCFESLTATRRLRHREYQRRYDLKKHGVRRSVRGRPSLGLTADQMRERRKKQNREAYERRLSTTLRAERKECV